MEERIIEATEYLLMAINDIKNFQDFINYKQELIKAINDIKNSLLHKIEINDSDENDKKSKISSILGLQFDYDSLLDEKDVKFFSEYENKNKKVKNIINTYLNTTGNINDKYKSKKKNMNNNNIKNTVLFRNKSGLYNPKTFNKKSNRNKFFNTQHFRSNSKTKIDKHFEESKQKGKIDRIAEIILKMKNEDYIYDIIVKLFGNDVTDQLLSKNVSDKLVEQVQNAIKEIEKFQKNEKNKKFNISKMNKIKLKKRSTKDLNINSVKNDKMKNMVIKPKRFKSSHKFKYSDPYQEFNFEQSLRYQTPKSLYKNNNSSINNEKSSSTNKNSKCNTKRMNSPKGKTYHQKPFISATCGYGNFFDEPLQKGGISKLDSLNKLLF
jgi:hypothetical protein